MEAQMTRKMLPYTEPRDAWAAVLRLPRCFTTPSLARPSLFAGD